MLPQTSWMSFDVTNTVKAIIKGEKPNYGFIFRVTPTGLTSGQSYSFYTFNNYMTSSDTYYSSWNEGMTPKLVVTYSDSLKYPSNLSPANSQNILNNSDITFKWNHNGYDISSTQSKYELMWSSNNGASWTTVTNASSNQFHTFPVGSFPNGTILWKVKTWDNQNISSVYSNPVQFNTVATPVTPTITVPTGTITTGKPTITWTSTNQAGYHIDVLDSMGNTYWSREELISTNKSVTMDKFLLTGSTYPVKVKILDNNGFWSNFTSTTITANLALPSSVKFTLIKKDIQKGGVIFSIVKDSTVLFYEVWRKLSAETEFERVASNLSNPNYSNYTQISGLSYDYKIRAYSLQGGYVESGVIQSKIDFRYSILSDLSNQNFLILKYRSKRNKDYSVDATFQRFAGRVNPIAEFSVFEDEGINYDFDCIDYAEISRLKDIINKRETLLIRDKLGLKMYGIIKNLSESFDERTKIWKYSFTFYKTDYSEVV